MNWRTFLHERFSQPPTRLRKAALDNSALVPAFLLADNHIQSNHEYPPSLQGSYMLRLPPYCSVRYLL